MMTPGAAPRRPPAAALARLGGPPFPPPNVVAACSGPRGVDYVRQILHTAGHRARRAAAAALGLHEQVLFRHRQHVE
jgi:hypothetical protein